MVQVPKLVLVVVLLAWWLVGTVLVGLGIVRVRDRVPRPRRVECVAIIVVDKRGPPWSCSASA